MTNVLDPPGASHPAAAQSRQAASASCPSEPVAYTGVKPRVVVELDVDTAIEHYKWRHACRFVRVRRDLKPADLPVHI